MSLSGDIIDAIEDAMAESEMSVHELSRLSGINRSALHRALGGRVEPRLETIDRIAAAMGLEWRFELGVDGVDRRWNVELSERRA